jgi:hypothetical protein
MGWTSEQWSWINRLSLACVAVKQEHSQYEQQ